MKKIKVNIKKSNYHYPIIIGSNIVSKFNQYIEENKLKISKYFVVVDKNVPKRIIAKLTNSITKAKVIIHYFEAKEKNKVQENVDIILNKMLKKNFTRIRVITEKKRGVSFARNLGIKNCKFNWIAFLDSDDEWITDKIEKQFVLLKKSSFKYNYFLELSL